MPRLTHILVFSLAVLAVSAWGVSRGPVFAQEKGGAAHNEASHDKKDAAKSGKVTGSHDKSSGHGAEHGAHVGAEGADPSPASFKKDLAIHTLVVFLLLLAVLYKFAWGPIVTGLQKREQGIADQIASAERSNHEAKQILADYQAKFDNANKEVQAIIDEARRDAASTKDEIIAAARGEATKEMDRAKREIETATAQAIKELANASANMAVDLAGKIVQSRLSATDHTRLIEDAVAKFPKASFQDN